MHALLRDLRFGARALGRARGFTIVAVLVLAVGIGATTTVFSIIDVLLFRPLNGAGRSDLVRVYSRERDGARDYRRFSYPNYEDLRQHRSVFADLAAYDYGFVGVTEGGATRRVFAGFVTSSYFDLVGVPMALGRSFAPVDDDVAAPEVAIVSHEFWMAAGSNPSLVGSELVVNGRARTVVGVTPPGFSGTMAVTAPPVWLPLGQTGGDVSRSARAPRELLRNRRHDAYGVVGRLADGLTVASAASRLEVVSRALEQAFPAENRNQALEIHPMPRIGDDGEPGGADTTVASIMTFVLAMAAAVLLVVALNLANLMVARGRLREREIAIRLAIGAGRWSVVRGLLAEASWLALLGGGLGLLLAFGASHLAASTLRPLLPMFSIVFDPTPDGFVLATLIGSAVLGTLVFGLGPALRLSRPDVVSTIKGQASVAAGRSSRGRAVAGNGLMVVQVALSLTLLTCGGLFLFGAVRADSADPGFSLDRGLLAIVDGSLSGNDRPWMQSTCLRVLERLRSLDGVASASLASTVPYGESSNGRGVQVAGARPDERAVGAVYREVGADYFKTLGVKVLAGREFTAAEESSTAPVQRAIIDARLAQRLWPNENAIGRQIQWDRQGTGTPPPMPIEVVGVVGSISTSLFDLAPRPHVYVPFGGRFQSPLTLHVRTSGEGAESRMLASVGSAIRSVDPTLPIVALKTLREHRDTGHEVWFVRLAAKVFTVFGGIALLVAVVGVYGVRAIGVGRRTREFGVRMALGATAGDVVRLVMAEGAWLAAVGLTAGILLSAGVSRLLSGWIYGVRAFEPVVFVVTVAVLVAATMLACYLPARRATRADPVAALRDQ